MDDLATDDGKNSGAVALGRKGDKVRMAGMMAQSIAVGDRHNKAGAEALGEVVSESREA